MLARGRLWEHPGHQKPPQRAQNTSILHKYFAHRFQRASWPALWQKPGQKYMSETAFGLRRRERIACWPFCEKVVLGPHFCRILVSIWVPKSSNLLHFALTMALLFAAGFGVVVGVMETTANHRTGGQTHIKPEVKVYLTDKAYD